MTNPLFNIGDTPYLRESAALGFLEAIRITSIQLSSNGSWLYSYAQGLAKLRTSTYGDRRSLVSGQVIVLDESELVDYCTALNLVKAQLVMRLTNINGLITNSNCI